MFYDRWSFKVRVIAYILSTYFVPWGNIACNTRRARLAPSNFLTFLVPGGRVNTAIIQTKEESDIMMKDKDEQNEPSNVLMNLRWLLLQNTIQLATHY